MLTGLILAGGKSFRMGRDKAFLEINGKPLLQLQMERLELAGCAEILISGPNNRGYERFEKQIVEDHIQNSGSLAGLCAGLAAAKNESILVLAIDLPNLTVEFLKWLIEQSKDHFLTCPQSENGFEPLCAIYHRQTCLPMIKKRLEQRQLTLQELIKELCQLNPPRIILPSEWKKWGKDLFHNWNTQGGFCPSSIR